MTIMSSSSTLTNNPIFCAIDTSNIETATNLVSQIKPHIGGIKLGLEFFTSCGIAEWASSKVNGSKGSY